MKQLSQAELEALMQRRDSVCVSIYAPMVKAGPETQQNAIRFKNLVRRAADTLEERGMTPKEVSRFLEPASDLIDDTPFWQHQSDGLAVFSPRASSATTGCRSKCASSPWSRNAST